MCQNFKAIGEELSEISDYVQTNIYIFIYIDNMAEIFGLRKISVTIEKIMSTRGIHKVSFPLASQLSNHLLRVRDRVITSLGVCTRGTSPSFHSSIVAAVKIEAPAGCEFRSVIKSFIAQSIVPIEIYR